MNESRSIFFEMNRRVRDKWRGDGKEVGNIYIYICTSVYLYDLWIESWMLRSRVIGDNKFSNVT